MPTYIDAMRKRLLPVVVFSLWVPPLAADEAGRSLMERGAELFFEGLRQEMEPALDNLRGLADEFGPAMQDFLVEMGPALAEIAREVQDWAAYEPPEILPNGDIIIRKKPERDDPAAETEQGATSPTDI